jgi:prefoldin subunit 5
MIMRTGDQINQRIAELKMDYVRLQEDIEKMESTGGVIDHAELQLHAIEQELEQLHKLKSNNP